MITLRTKDLNNENFRTKWDGTITTKACSMCTSFGAMTKVNFICSILIIYVTIHEFSSKTIYIEIDI